VEKGCCSPMVDEKIFVKVFADTELFCIFAGYL
jgi:hypothetical protein